MKKPVSKEKNNPSSIDLLILIFDLFYLFILPLVFKIYTSKMAAGLPHIHKMVVKVLTTTFLKSKPMVITYRDFRLFDNKFKTDLKNSSGVRNVLS